jgi:hypothetical protein
MRLALVLVALGILSAASAAPAAAQQNAPITGVPGVPDESAVVDVSTLPSTPPIFRLPVSTGLVHIPRRRPPDSERPVPDALRRESLAPARPTVPLGPSPALAGGFSGLDDPNTVIPPDTNGAVGPNHLMVTLNSQVHFQNRGGSPLGAPVTLDTFWSAVDGGGGTFDPKTLYDPFANRWISVACDDAQSTSSAILVGVSQTGNPMGSWFQFRIDADPGPGPDVWADFPSVGFNGKWVVVQLNMFTIPGMYVRSNIYVFDRTALYGGNGAFTLIEDDQGFTQAPAVTYDMAQPDLFMLEEWNGGFSALRLTKLSGPVGSPALSVVSFPIGPTTWTPGPASPDQAPQLGSAQRISTNDARIQSLVFRNNTLWTAHTVFASTPGPVGRAGVQWWQLSTAGSPLQTGRIEDVSATNFYAFPSIAVNKFDDVLLAFSCFSATRFASACYAFRKSTDAPNTFNDVATLKDGQSSYFKTFSGTANRWGDYSAAQVDPRNDVDLWTLQEYAATPANRWGTWWGLLALPPDITIDDVSLVEGNAGTTNARFTISLSFASSQLVEVDWVAKDGTATLADSDFQAASGRASFAPGTTSVLVDVAVVGDLKLEPNETFSVELSSPLFGVIADALGQGTILDDDAVPLMSIDDVRIVEGDFGSSTAKFTVTLSNPSGATVSASWNTTDGIATAVAGDYVAGSGTVSFPPGTTSQPVDVLVSGDTSLETDETFHADLKAPVGATLSKPRGVGTILDDDLARPPVRSFTVVSSGDADPTSGNDRLQWVNPAGGNPVEIRIRFTKRAGGCTPPSDPDATYDGLIQVFPPNMGSPGEPRAVDNKNLDLGTSYCYTIWVIHSGGAASSGVSATGRPFDATGPLRWKYSTSGTTGVAPPTVGLQGVLAVDNAGEVQAMTRSGGGGPWPAGPPVWNPLVLGSPSQSRNPIVPIAGLSRFYVTTQDGRVHSIDNATGALDWSQTVAPPKLNGAPAGIFSAFGGQHDAIFAGTSETDDNVLHALDPATGAPLGAFAPPGMGPILGMPAVDYSTSPERVYFASRRGSAAETLWCVELGPPGPIAFVLRWSRAVGDISGSVVLRNGRIYVGTDAGEVLSVRADDGGDPRLLPLNDGPVRGFVFPDRTNDELFASTNTAVWRLSDGPPLVVKSSTAVDNPSPPLLWPGTTHVYVGGGDGQLHEIDTQTAVHKTLPLDYDPATFVVGAPSLDVGFRLLHVGSERGTFYAVEVPLP